jgi:hypothetical protein
VALPASGDGADVVNVYVMFPLSESPLEPLQFVSVALIVTVPVPLAAPVLVTAADHVALMVPAPTQFTVVDPDEEVSSATTPSSTRVTASACVGRGRTTGSAYAAKPTHPIATTPKTTRPIRMTV